MNHEQQLKYSVPNNLHSSGFKLSSQTRRSIMFILTSSLAMTEKSVFSKDTVTVAYKPLELSLKQEIQFFYTDGWGEIGRFSLPVKIRYHLILKRVFLLPANSPLSFLPLGADFIRTNPILPHPEGKEP